MDNIMKTRRKFVFALALVAGIYATNHLVSCSEDTTSNPIESIAPAVDNTQTSTDTSAGSREQAQPMAAAINWNSLNAMSKRQLLLETAYRDYVTRAGARTGYTCKTWAQTMVTRASGGAASLPTTVNDGYGYYFTSLSHVTQVLQNQPYASYTHFLPGRVLQMWYGGPNKPHTAFIYSSSPSGMQWLDCNFVGGAGNGIVGIHSISWTEFRQKVPNFTLYEVY